MAKLTTTYDSTLKEKIFVLKGEEAYARSTDCILEEVLHNGERRADWNTDIKAMKLEFHIDVLRDIGASYVTLYDNDDVIAVYDFDTNTHAIDLIYDEDTGIDNRIELNYDVEHHIYAKYMGNKQCLKSQSKSYMVSEPLPSSYESTLEFVDMGSQYLTTDPLTINVRLSGTDYYQDQDIVFFDNNTRLGTVKTDLNGEASFTIEDISEGVHTFLARFNGTDHLSSVEETMDTSVGVIYRFVEYPSYTINRQGFNVKLTANDYLGEPIQKKLDVSIRGYYDGYWIGMGQGYCENGVAIINVEYPDLDEITSRIVSGLSDGATPIAGSQEITVTPYENVTVSLNQPSTFTAYGRSLTLTGQVSNVSEAVTVSLNQGLGTVKTDTNGNFSVTYNGTGVGIVTVTASIGNVSGSVSFEDVMQYWKAPSTIWNREYTLYSMTVSDLTNGFVLSSSASNNSLHLPNGQNDIEFDVVSISGTFKLTESDTFTPIPISLKASDHVELTKSGKRISVIVNGVNVTTVDDDRPYLRFGLMQQSQSITINNVKVRRG